MFLLFGLWWTLRIAQIRYYTSGVSSPRRPPRRRKALPDPTAIRLAFGSHKYPRFPVEAVGTIILTTVGIVIEGVQAVGAPPEGGWLAISNTMHVTMYTAFAVEMGREPATPMEKVALDMAIDDSSEVELILAQDG
uniref:Uncharacterized protein n=1 Tax=Plectus sambesii TaxID=2011161 RepID=A0A914W0A4_9BILA